MRLAWVSIKTDIRQVIHEAMPATIANYMQEIGRAGRDGKDALAFLLYAEGDEQFVKFIVTEDLPRPAHATSYANALARRENPTTMIHNGEISETAFRVLDYWMQREPLEAVNVRLQAMEIKKYEAVQEMMGIVETERCMRETVVAHFGQNLQQKPMNCCTNCGINFDQLVEKRTFSEGKSIHYNLAISY